MRHKEEIKTSHTSIAYKYKDLCQKGAEQKKEKERERKFSQKTDLTRKSMKRNVVKSDKHI